MYELSKSDIYTLVNNALQEKGIVFNKLEINIYSNIITRVNTVKMQIVVDQIEIVDVVEVNDAEALRNQYFINAIVTDRLVRTIVREINEKKTPVNEEQGWAYEKNYCKVELHMNGQIIDAFFRPQPDLTAYEYSACRAVIAGAIVGSKLKYLVDHDALRHWELVERLDKKGNKIYTYTDGI